eukprot:5577045-Pyramimonas_sp.AAC.2
MILTLKWMRTGALKERRASLSLQREMCLKSVRRTPMSQLLIQATSMSSTTSLASVSTFEMAEMYTGILRGGTK